MEGEIKKINGIFPATVDTAVKIEGTNKTLRVYNKENERTTPQQEIYKNIKFDETLCDKPIVCFVDDDGRKGVYTKLYPMFKHRGVKFTSALVPGLLGDSDGLYMTEEEVDIMANDDFEFINHTYWHIPYNSTTSIEQWEEEIVLAKNWLYRKGLRHDVFVQPQNEGIYSPAIDIVKKHSNACVWGTAAGGVNAVGKDPYSISRRGLGSYDDNSTLDEFKTIIDNCFTNNSWIIFMLHIDQTTSERQTIIEGVLDYVISKNIAILPVGEAMKIKLDKLRVNSKTIIDYKGNLKTS